MNAGKTIQQTIRRGVRVRHHDGWQDRAVGKAVVPEGTLTTLVSGDVNGDCVADFAVRLTGSHTLTGAAVVL